MERMNTYNQGREDDFDPRFNWSQGDADYAMRQAMQPETRQVQGYDASGKPAQLWEYLVGGKWYNQNEYDDPRFQQNVFNPWRDKIQNEWRLKMEDLNKRKQQYNSAQPFPQFGKPGSRGAGPVGSRGGGGGGGRYDPAMIASLIGG